MYTHAAAFSFIFITLLAPSVAAAAAGYVCQSQSSDEAVASLPVQLNSDKTH